MAAVPSNRRVDAHGSLRKEVGTLTYTSAGNFATRLTKVLWFEMTGATTGECSGTHWINSKTASAVQDDPGWVHISAGYGGGNYTYVAIGRGA